MHVQTRICSGDEALKTLGDCEIQTDYLIQTKRL